MARRSLLKRIQRGLGSLYKSTLKNGKKLEAKLTEQCNAYAGPEVVEKMNKCCTPDSETCYCRNVREEVVRSHVACFPHKIMRFKDEWAYFRASIKSPGDMTMGDLAPWPLAIFLSVCLFYLGVCAGRGSFVDYKYRDDEK